MLDYRVENSAPCSGQYLGICNIVSNLARRGFRWPHPKNSTHRRAQEGSSCAVDGENQRFRTRRTIFHPLPQVSQAHGWVRHLLSFAPLSSEHSPLWRFNPLQAGAGKPDNSSRLSPEHSPATGESPPIRARCELRIDTDGCAICYWYLIFPRRAELREWRPSRALS